MTLSVVSAAEFLRRPEARRGGWVPSPELVSKVGHVIADVRIRGDAALVEYGRRFDDPSFDLAKLRVPIPMLENARALVPPEIADALQLECERIERFHESCRPSDRQHVDADGTRYAMRYRPYGSVALYAHAGPGSGPSSVLSGAIPARLAGVSRVVVLAAPTPRGGISPAILFACALGDVDELYALGGAHAMAAAAFGTESILPVEKIVGAGGSIVTEAKRQLFGVCAVDAIAGPAHVMVLADEGASTEYVLGEVLAQTERDPFAWTIVLSESRELLEAVAQLMDTLEVHALDASCSLVLAQNRREAQETIDRVAPDVLIVQVRDPEPYLTKSCHPGAILVGDMTPLASARYLLGAPMSEFLEAQVVLENSRERMLGDGQRLGALCEFEGLTHHAHGARLRNG
jgi:histidinol dehydrogenase